MIGGMVKIALIMNFNIFKSKLKSEKPKYREKIIEEVKSIKRGSSYSALKKLSLRPDHVEVKSFTLPRHYSMSVSQSSDTIAKYFSDISQQYEPLSYDNLPPNIQTYIFSHLKMKLFHNYQIMIFIKELNSEKR